MVLQAHMAQHKHRIIEYQAHDLTHDAPRLRYPHDSWRLYIRPRARPWCRCHPCMLTAGSMSAPPHHCPKYRGRAACLTRLIRLWTLLRERTCGGKVPRECCLCGYSWVVTTVVSAVFVRCADFCVSYAEHVGRNRACMWVCVCMYVVYVCVYVVQRRLCLYVCVCMYVCMYIRMYVFMYDLYDLYVCMYVCLFVCMYVCMYVFMYVCMICMYDLYARMCVCVYVCINICIYTHS